MKDEILRKIPEDWRAAKSGSINKELAAQTIEAVIDTVELLRSQLAALRQRVEDERWVAVGERLPDDYIDVLVTVAGRDLYRIACQEDGRWMVQGPKPDDWCYGHGFTHWCPLPQPPAAGQKEN